MNTLLERFMPPRESLLTEDDRFMGEALKEAIKAYQKEEVPIGSVMVAEGKVVARGYNQVELLRDATAHAEMLCISSAQQVIDNWRLSGMTMYCTAEPCSMCAGAMLLSRIKTLVWGTVDKRHGANGSWIDILGRPHPMHLIEVRRGVLEEPCSRILKCFFREMRRKKSSKDHI